MTLFTSDDVTAIFALGQWFEIVPGTIHVGDDFCLLCPTKTSTNEGEVKGYMDYRMWAAYPPAAVDEDGMDDEDLFCYDIGHYAANAIRRQQITFTEAHTKDSVSMSLVEVKAFRWNWEKR